MRYKLQLLFYEDYDLRAYDILVDGVPIIEQFSPHELAGVQVPGVASFVAYEFVFLPRSSNTTAATGHLIVKLVGNHRVKSLAAPTLAMSQELLSTAGGSQSADEVTYGAFVLANESEAVQRSINSFPCVPNV